MSSEDTSDSQAHLQRGLALLDLSRHAEAERFLRLSLAADPNQPTTLFLLSHSVTRQEGRDQEALEIIDQAIALDPETALFHAQRSRLLSGLKRYPESEKAADAAVSLEPLSEDGYVAKGLCYLRQARWAEAEEQARAALALDADDVTAQNILSQTLQFQGKTDESESDVRVRLARSPDDSFTHFNAGYAALRRGDHKAAEGHFIESLRLDPNFEAARQGLLESFRARSPFYRAWLKYVFLVARLSEKGRWAFALGVYVLYRVLRAFLKTVSPTLAMLVGMLWIGFVFWSYVARGIGNLFILFDSHARLALKTRERWEGILVGGGVLCAIGFVIGGLLLGSPVAVGLGLALGWPTIPLALTLSNSNPTGVKLYGTLAALTILGSVADLAAICSETLDKNPFVGTCSDIGLYAFVASTFLGAFNVKQD